MRSLDAIPQCDAMAQRSTRRRCVLLAGHPNDHYYPGDWRLYDASNDADETDRSRLMAENAALREQRDRLLAVLHDIYPALASRVIALKAAGETVALAEWEGIARLVSDATREAR
jgi:hypothetical protein